MTFYKCISIPCPVRAAEFLSASCSQKRYVGSERFREAEQDLQLRPRHLLDSWRKVASCCPPAGHCQDPSARPSPLTPTCVHTAFTLLLSHFPKLQRAHTHTHTHTHKLIEAAGPHGTSSPQSSIHCPLRAENSAAGLTPLYPSTPGLGGQGSPNLRAQACWAHTASVCLVYSSSIQGAAIWQSWGAAAWALGTGEGDSGV